MLVDNVSKIKLKSTLKLLFHYCKTAFPLLQTPQANTVILPFGWNETVATFFVKSDFKIIFYDTLAFQLMCVSILSVMEIYCNLNLFRSKGTF